MIAGRSLLARTVALARLAIRDLADIDLVVATDHLDISLHAQALGCATVMTDPDIQSGSGRAFAAASAKAKPPGIVLNLQGDSPFLAPDTIARVLTAARVTRADVVTPLVGLDWEALDAMRAHKRGSPFSGTTCIRAADGRAVWFSKTVLPAMRNEAQLRATLPRSPVWRHIGLYAYTLGALAAFEAAPPSAYETLEGLEQLRLIEMGLTIQTVESSPPLFDISGIDTAEDVARAEALIARFGDPYREC